MTRWVYAVLLGLVGAGIVHIVIVLLLPVVSDRNAWAALSAAPGAFEQIATGGPPDAPLAGSVDPLFAAVACRFDLEAGPRHITGPVRSPYWSLSVYDRLGTNVYSLNDRTSPESRLDVVVLSPAQMLELRKDIPDALAASVFVETELGSGIVVVRSFIPDDTWEALARDFVEGARCTPVDLSPSG